MVIHSTRYNTSVKFNTKLFKNGFLNSSLTMVDSRWLLLDGWFLIAASRWLFLDGCFLYVVTYIDC